MSSRARLVAEEAQAYDWRAAPVAPILTRQLVEAIEIPEGEPDPELEPELVDLPDESRLAEIEHDAYATGYAKGERAGADAAAAEARALLHRVAETIEELSSTRQDMIRRTERQVVELALTIARQMLQREINADRGLLLAMARVALDGLGDHEAATIRLHPDDYAIVSASPDGEWANGRVTVVADAAVERNGCVVQCDAGLMKVGLESQFNELARTLLGEQASEPGDRDEARHGATAS